MVWVINFGELNLILIIVIISRDFTRHTMCLVQVYGVMFISRNHYETGAPYSRPPELLDWVGRVAFPGFPNLEEGVPDIR